jgi:hypothetical protein
VELHLHSPNTPSWRGAQLKHGENFTFIFTLTDETKHVVMSRHQNVRSCHSLLSANKSNEHVAMFRYLGITVKLKITLTKK